MTTNRKPLTLEEQRQYVQQWKRTGEELRLIKMAELAAMTDEDTRDAVATLLSSAFTRTAYKNPKYEQYSGLIEQQAYFQKMHHDRNNLE